MSNNKSTRIILDKINIKSLDILVPYRNEANFIGELLLSLESLTLPDDLKVNFIFSDNASTDKSVDIIKNSNLKNLFLFQQSKNIGAIQNFIFLLKKSKSDYFMFIDGHDRISPNYLVEFFKNATIYGSENLAYIGHVIELNESSGIFMLGEVQNQLKFSRYSRVRKLQAALFLYHNSIWHSIFPRKFFQDISEQTREVHSFDHLVTYIGLANCNLKYLDGTHYIRRYRQIVNRDFSHLINGEVVSRAERVQGESKVSINDLNIANHLRLNKSYESKLTLRLFFCWLIDKKMNKSEPGYTIFRMIRFFMNRILHLRPEK